MSGRMTTKIVRGLRLGKLVILDELPCRLHGDRQWAARCDCGAVIADSACHLRHRTSCGSHRCRKQRSDSNGGYALHDKALRIPEYAVWSRMKYRCSNPSSPRYRDYGARGVFVCERWQHFELFIKDMGHRPSSDHSIDRIDNNGPYSPENCRWATRSDQMRNRRNSVWLEYNGKRRIMADWARLTGLPEKLLQNRKKLGWADEKILTVPPKPDRRRSSAICFVHPDALSR